MNLLDIRTIMVCFIIVDLIITLVLVLLWLQNRARFNGIFFWVINFLFQTSAMALITFRGQIPDWLSFIASNALSLTGITLGYIGLLRVLGYPVKWIFNAALILVYIIIQYYFVFIQPDLNIRNLALALAAIVIFSQCAWLMLIKVPDHLKKLTRFVGIIFSLYVLANFARVIHYFAADPVPNDYLHSGDFQAFILVAYQILIILLVFSLALMFNNFLQEKITRQEEKFSKAFYSAPYAILISRLSDDLIIEVNKGFIDAFGYTLEELNGKSTMELNIWRNPSDRDAMVDMIRKNGKIMDLEAFLQKKSGEPHISLFSAEVININNEECLIASINDITQKNATQQALVESEQKLRALNASKDKFFSIIAHDLKSPFNSIIGFSSLLQERIGEKDNEGIAEYGTIIQNAAQRAMSLLMNLLEWSRSQTGRMEFAPEYLEMAGLINETVEIFSDVALQKSISISKDIPHTAVALADRAMTATILRNLISNAIKFSMPDSTIIIRIEQKSKELVVSITDNGIGISKDDLGKLFRIEEGFSTLGTQNEKGTGLGLILCKEFVEKHGGKIWAVSELGKGSTFYFTLPRN